ncbi:twin-arginine translocation signal domain-containing protein [Rhizobium sp. AG207R]|uniref:twin-arginine translocation signal domain-containing protein n=1 Tax=Rhizobium sp. AG207R TaxID=2802287 RepID=UPI0022ABE996|nr:twin-arginine translocation signal domain-containing protein [Rhizobium sp. AG207R]MCZ3377440.1 twin-arginine translocation signal domain-containing protein [Rhizobium sp. AG207R]
METTRRSFLRGLLTITAAAVVLDGLPLGQKVASAPVLYADGIHDDSDALEAMFDGRPFRVDGANVIAHDGILANAYLSVSRPIRPKGDFTIMNCYIVQRPEFKGEAMMILGTGYDMSGIQDLYLDNSASKPVTFHDFAARSA